MLTKPLWVEVALSPNTGSVTAILEVRTDLLSVLILLAMYGFLYVAFRNRRHI